MRELHVVASETRRPWPGTPQQQFAEDWAHSFVSLEGGWGAGKTWVGARKLMSLHIHNAFDDDGRATYVPSAVVAPTYSNALDFDVPEIMDACREMGLAARYQSSGSVGGQFSGPAFVLPDLGTKARPSVIIVRSADAPARITGWEVGAGWGDEPARWPEDRHDPTRDAYIQFCGRVRHPQARLVQIMFTGTNEGDATRIYEEFHAGRPEFAVYRMPTADNPTMAEFVARQKEVLTPELAAQYLDGGAITLRGAKLYPSFDRSVHVNDALAIDTQRPLHVCLDFNIAPGMHAELGHYIQERDMYVVVDEIHGPRMDVRGVMLHLRDKIEALRDARGRWPFPGPLELFGDATGNSEWAGTGESCWGIVRQALHAYQYPHQIRVPRANPPVVDRVNAFNVAMLDMQGDVHWQCSPRCDRLIDDLRRLKRDKLGQIDQSDRRLSHATDAEGYRLAYLRPARLVLDDGIGGRVSV